MTVEQSILLITVTLSGGLLLLLWHSRRRRRARLAGVAVVVLPAIHAGRLNNERDISVYLPPGYEIEHDRHYPVLYINDGQDMAQLQLRETLAQLFAQRRLAPLIAVAIPTNEQRLQEYGTAITPNAQGLGKRAAAYSHFVTEELRAVINGRFRTQTVAAANAILGASLGGLSAFDIAWNHPQHFATVGVLSGAFWWRAAPDDSQVTPNRRIMHAVVRDSVYRPGFRAWFEAGTRDERSDRDNNGVIDAIQDTTELIDELTALGYKSGRDVIYYELFGGRHNYDTWSRVLPHFLTWAFPP